MMIVNSGFDKFDLWLERKFDCLIGIENINYLLYFLGYEGIF